MARLSLLILVVVAAAMTGCGQSKVEYKKTEAAKEVTDAPSSPPETAPAGEGAPEAADGDAIRHIYSRVGAPTDSPNMRFRWQRWEAPEKRGWGKLGGDELSGLGDIADESYAESHGGRVVTLEGVSGRRCVFRNRLIEAAGAKKPDFAAIRTSLPKPFGEMDLLCIQMPDEITSRIQLNLRDNGMSDKIRWLGTSAVKEYSPHGASVVEFKVTSRIAYRQAFPKATQAALLDDFDVLLNTSATRAGPDSCAVERTMILAVTMEEGKPKRARLSVHTRNFSLHDFMDSWLHNGRVKPVGGVHTNPDLPVLDATANGFCAPQHRAWTYCLNASPAKPDGVACQPRITRILETNFRGLLDARLPGFGTDRMFVLTRAEANGVNGRGALALWHDASVAGSNAQAMNPLALEDFQELTDFVDLEVVSD